MRVAVASLQYLICYADFQLEGSRTWVKRRNGLHDYFDLLPAALAHYVYVFTAFHRIRRNEWLRARNPAV